jgi:hypothetical protein
MEFSRCSRGQTSSRCTSRLGKVRYSITEHEKVTLMTFPLDDGILCVSASPKADINKIRNKVSKVIKERPAAKKKKKKPTK